jgi:hypothetical protein
MKEIKIKEYKSNEYCFYYQKHVQPLWCCDELNNKQYLGTVTFAKYNDKHLLITANHVIDESLELKDLFFITLDGYLYLNKIVDKIDRDENLDLAVMVIDMNKIRNNKIFFDLEYQINNPAQKNSYPIDEIDWIGFPKQKKKNSFIHRSKNYENGRINELLAKDPSKTFEPFIDIQEYRIFQLEKDPDNKLILNNKKPILYEFSKKVGKIPSLIGMSGGAIYGFSSRYPKNIELIGIAIEYNKKTGIVKIVDKNSIVAFIKRTNNT